MLDVLIGLKHWTVIKVYANSWQSAVIETMPKLLTRTHNMAAPIINNCWDNPPHDDLCCRVEVSWSDPLKDDVILRGRIFVTERSTDTGVSDLCIQRTDTVYTHWAEYGAVRVLNGYKEPFKLSVLVWRVFTFLQEHWK